MCRLLFLLNDRGQSPAGKRPHGTRRRAPWGTGRRERPNIRTWEPARPVGCENCPSELQHAALLCPGSPQTGAREQRARLFWVDSWTHQPNMKNLFWWQSCSLINWSSEASALFICLNNTFYLPVIIQCFHSKRLCSVIKLQQWLNVCCLIGN